MRCGNGLLLLQNLPTDGAFLAIGKAVLGTGGSLSGDGFFGMTGGRDGNRAQFPGAVFVLEVLVTDRAVVMQLDTIFGTGGFRTVHLGEAVSLGGDFFLGCQNLTADRAVAALS